MDPRHSYPPDLVGVVLESYAYCELCASLRMLPGQDDIAAACRVSEEHLATLQRYRTFGVVFTGCSSLFRLVPFICQLATDRRIELLEDQDLGCRPRFDDLRRIIEGWSPLTDGDSTSCRIGVSSAADVRDLTMAGNVVRNALVMFLTSSYHNDVEYLRKSLHSLVEETIEYMTVASVTEDDGLDERHPVAKPSWINVLFWPMVAVATYTTTATQRERMLSFLGKDMPVYKRVKQTLRWVWEADDSVYGLQGLSDMLELHKADFPFG